MKQGPGNELMDVYFRLDIFTPYPLDILMVLNINKEMKPKQKHTKSPTRQSKMTQFQAKDNKLRRFQVLS